MTPRTLSARALFAVVYTTAISSLYFALGVAADRALGLLPVVFLVAGLFFSLTAMSYIEASGMHQEPGGASVFARYAFNELVSFVAGWAIVLDYILLVAVTAVAAANYAGTFWSPLGEGVPEVLLSLAVVAYAAWNNVLGISARRLQGRIVIAVVDLALQVGLIVLGLALVFRPEIVIDPIQLGVSPSWGDVVFALTIAAVAFTGLEAAASLSREVNASRRDLRRLAGPGSAAIVLVYAGMALVAISALPVHDGHTALADQYGRRPLVGVAVGLDAGRISDWLMYLVAAVAVVSLVAAANSAMLGVSRTALALATNRQIPGALGRLHPVRGTPVVVIVAAAVIAAALVVPTDIEFLVGTYAFGTMLAFTIAHAAVIRLRFREPAGDRPYRVPGSFPFRGGSVPVPALIGFVASFAGWITVLVLHDGARFAGLGWMAAGVVFYIVYRRRQGTPILERVTVPERALRVPAEAMEPEFGSILVPIFGSELDVDIVQTAGRLAGEERDDLESDGAVIEALWIFEMPMALAIDARLPDAQLGRAREALARAKAVGEEYDGVEVATATVRTRRAGQAIVEQAERRGVEAIVLAAEPASRIRGGASLGGRGGLEDYVGDITKYVLKKATCRVILTAPEREKRIEQPARVRGTGGAGTGAPPPVTR